MNIIAIDIGNTNINVGLFIEGSERRIETVAGEAENMLVDVLEAAWAEVPEVKAAKKATKDGYIVASSVKPASLEMVQRVVKEKLGEKVLVVGEDVGLPIKMKVDDPKKVGTDRVVAAAAAYAVVEQAVVIANFGTATTIDIVDDKGEFLGGVIAPGIKMGAEALNKFTAKLPLVKLKKPEGPWGTNTEAAINAGLYFGAVGLLHEVVRRYAEKIDKWPHTVITGGNAGLIHEDCDFVDTYVPHLVIKGIAFAFRNYLDAKGEAEEE